MWCRQANATLSPAVNHHAIHLLQAPQVPAGCDPAGGMALLSLYDELRDVEEMLAKRGIDVTYETVRC